MFHFTAPLPSPRPPPPSHPKFAKPYPPCWIGKFLPCVCVSMCCALFFFAIFSLHSEILLHPN